MIIHLTNQKLANAATMADMGIEMTILSMKPALNAATPLKRYESPKLQNILAQSW